MTFKEDNYWDLDVNSKIKLIDLKLTQIIHYRDLIFLFVKRDFTTVYKQTVLGPLWFIINPLISTVLYTFVFGKLANIGTDGIPSILFYYAGTMLWTYFSTCLLDAANVFSNNIALFGKVYFPRLTVPISRVFSNLITAGIQFVMLVFFYVYYLIFTNVHVSPSYFVFFIPIIFMWIGTLAVGMGMIISALTTKYKDLRQLLTFGVSLMMYATPVVYPLSQTPLKYRWLFFINPVSTPIELFRQWFYGSGSVNNEMILISSLLTLFLFLFGLAIFNYNERTFIDVI